MLIKNGCILASCFADPRVLHSFPTRRSSDLGQGSVVGDRQCQIVVQHPAYGCVGVRLLVGGELCGVPTDQVVQADRKSTRLNSSHVEISYAVFCLKKKKKDV